MIKQKKELTIQILGGAADGKTLMALALKKFLTEQGFTDIIVSDSDIDEHTEHTQKLIENFDAAWKDYSTNADVIVATKYVTRNSFLR